MCATNGFVTALVLAGSRGGPEPVALAEGIAHKALAQVGDATMLDRVLAALREAGIERVFVSTNVPAVAHAARRAGAEVIAAQAGPSESVARALELTGAPLLVTTADHPLLAPDWIKDFIAQAGGQADVAVMLARREDVEAVVPNTRRTWFRFADGDWSGCNLFLLATSKAYHAVDQWQMVESERKRPWRIAARLGWGTLFQYLIGRLTMADAIGRVGRRAGVKAVLVPAIDGKAAVDVDKVDDLLLVRSLLAGDRIESVSVARPRRATQLARSFFPFFPRHKVPAFAIGDDHSDASAWPSVSTVASGWNRRRRSA